MGYQGRSRRISAKTTSQQYKLAVLLSSPKHKDSPNTLRELQGIQSQADDVGIQVEVDYAVDYRHQPFTEEDLNRRQQILEYLQSQRHHAVILLGRHDPNFVSTLRQQFIPVVALSWKYPNVDHDLVSSNNMTDFSLATQKLIELGHTRITYVDECYKASFHDQRHAGFLQACCVNGLDLTQQSFFTADGYDDQGNLLDDAVDKLIANGYTACACANDRVAYLLWEALAKRHINVPDQMSIIGYDGMHPIGNAPLRLATMSQDFMELGRACVSLAYRRITQPSSSNWSVSINGHWLQGQTIAQP